MRANLILLLLGAAAAADELHLKDGRVLSGQVALTDGHYTVVDRDKKHVGAATDVDRLVKKPCFMDEYESRLAGVSKTDAEALHAFGTWLTENEWTSRARVVFEEVIRLDPDHREARAALGHKLFEGEWVSPEELNRRQGLVEFEGHWYTPHDLAALKKEIESDAEAREALRQQRDITQRLGEIVPKFATFDKEQRRKAHEELAQYADGLKSPVLRKFADDTRAYYDSLARALCLKMTTRAQVNLTETELIRPIPAVETNLGGIVRIQPLLFGRSLILVPETSPVQIQLPQIDIYQTQSAADIPSGCK
jgi:hypothetical protein